MTFGWHSRLGNLLFHNKSELNTPNYHQTHENEQKKAHVYIQPMFGFYTIVFVASRRPRCDRRRPSLCEWFSMRAALFLIEVLVAATTFRINNHRSYDHVLPSLIQNVDTTNTKANRKSYGQTDILNHADPQPKPAEARYAFSGQSNGREDPTHQANQSDNSHSQGSTASHQTQISGRRG